jgi:hypothetical protein
MIDYAAILSRKYSQSEWSLNGDEYSGLIWYSDTSKPSKATLDNLWTIVQEEIAAEKITKETQTNASFAKLEALGLTAADIKNIIEGIN